MPVEIQLREVTDSDLPIFFEHESDPVAVRMAAFTSEDPTDHDAFLAHWARIRAKPSITIRTIVHDGQVVGHLAGFERDGTPEITYWLGREHWGRGLATAAVREFLKIETRRPLYARAAADNAASIRVLEKCGFVVETRERGFANARGAEIEEVVMRLG